MPPLHHLILLLLGFVSSSLQSPIILPLYHHGSAPTPARANPLEHLSALASSSLLRASEIKINNKKSRKSSQPIPTPLSPHSYGGYSIPLQFGTPPQQPPLSLLLDTASSLTWIPCTPSYRCTACSAAPIPHFLPKSSTSSRLVGCRNPKCSWIHPSPLSCSPSNPICPPYAILYGSGSTAGLLLSETMHLAPQTSPIPDFAVGCSVYSDRQPSAGIAGFGRGAISFPSQLHLSKFSYCLISRRFDDLPAPAGSLVLNGSIDNNSIKYTPFAKNPSNTSSVSGVYYYVSLNKISVGGVKIKFPRSAIELSAAGDGGMIVDSGTTFTYMAPEVFRAVAMAFESKVGYRRSEESERRTGLRPCFELPLEGKVELPVLALKFKGGAEMRLPLANYFVIVDGSVPAVACLTVVTNDGGDGGNGPAVILGSFQQQNYHIVYDLERERFGFRQQSCVAAED